MKVNCHEHLECIDFHSFVLRACSMPYLPSSSLLPWVAFFRLNIRGKYPVLGVVLVGLTLTLVARGDWTVARNEVGFFCCQNLPRRQLPAIACGDRCLGWYLPT